MLAAFSNNWRLLDGAVLWLIAYRVPQYFVAELGPSLTPILPQLTNLKLASLYALTEVITTGLVAVFTRLYGLTLRQIGLTKPGGPVVGPVVGGYIIYFGLSFVLALIAASLFQIPDNESQELGFENIGLLDGLTVFFILTIVVPFTEELLFRGFLFHVVRQRLSLTWTALIVSVLFGLVHGSVVVGIDVFALSLVLCYLREHTGSLWPGIILHGLKNTVAFVLIFIYNVS